MSSSAWPMRMVLAALAAGAVALGGCNQSGEPGEPSQPSPLFSLAPQPAAAEEEGEGGFSILLQVFSDPASHAADASYYKSQTEKVAGWKGLRIAARAGHSELYMGTYRTLDEATKNLKVAKAYKTPAGVQLYPKAIVVPIQGKDVGPAEWNLLNAKGAYTVVVAVFYDVSEAKYFGRRGSAVQYCRQLREKGYEAYFHHGPSQSKVTVGAFPPSAVRTIENAQGIRLEIVEPRIEQLVNEFKYLAVNGYSERRTGIDRKTGKGQREFVKPYPVNIPHKEDANDNAFDYRSDAKPR